MIRMKAEYASDNFSSDVGPANHGRQPACAEVGSCRAGEPKNIRILMSAES